MADKHTHGPWWSPDGKTIKQDYRPLTEVGGCIIAGVMGGSTSGPFFIEVDEEVSANARLIAAAPELLEALDRLVKWGQAQKTADGSGFHSLEQAREAIAKARGDQ